LPHSTLQDPVVLGTGYNQSKWAGEQLVLQARRKGLQATVVRLGRIGACSRTGAFNRDDFFCLFVKGCLQMHCFSEQVTLNIDAIPADRTAEVAVNIALRPPAPGASHIFHLGNPQPAPLGLAIGLLREMGYAFDVRPYSLWRERLVATTDADNALRPLEASFPAGFLGQPTPSKVTLDCSNAGLQGPTITETELRLMLTKMREVGFIPSP